MIYFELINGKKLLVLDQGHIQMLHDGENIVSPDGSVAVMLTPDIEWLTREIVAAIKASTLDGELFDKLHDQSMRREPPAQTTPYRPLEQIIRFGKRVGKAS
jgi:hypothetical protein